MRLYLICIIFGFANTLPIKSQFFAIRTASIDGSTYDGVYSNLWRLSNDRYAVNLHKYDSSGEIIRTRAYIYNSNKVLIDSISFPPRFYPMDCRPAKINENLFFGGLQIDTTVSPKKYFYAILCMDTLGNVIQIQKVRYISSLQLYYAYDRVMSNVIVAGGNLFFAGKDSTGGQSRLVVYKLNQNFQKLDSIFLNTVSPRGPIRLLEIDDKILIANFGFSICPQNGPAGIQTILLDQNLQFIFCKNYGNLPTIYVNSQNQLAQLDPLCFNLQKISNTKFALNCMTAFDYATPPQTLPPKILFNSINVVSDLTLNVTSRTIFFDGVSGTGYYPNSDFTDINEKTNEIVTIGRVGWNYSASIMGQNTSTKMLFTKIDSAGNIKWAKQIWDGHMYAPSSVICTEDGGYIISGIRSADTSGQSQRTYEAFLYRLDDNGNVNPTNINEVQPNISSFAKCFPNPITQDQLSVEFSSADDLCLEIFNILGISLQVVPNYKSLQPINVASVPNGTYFVQLTGANFVRTAKFVINR